MSVEDYAEFRFFEDTITIYRGVRNPKPQNVRALSWTLDSEVAYFFANRFGDNGKVFQAQIDKQHILAFFNNEHNESEVVVDPRYLTNIKEYVENTDIFDSGVVFKN